MPGNFCQSIAFVAQTMGLVCDAGMHEYTTNSNDVEKWRSDAMISKRGAVTMAQSVIRRSERILGVTFALLVIIQK